MAGILKMQRSTRKNSTCFSLAFVERVLFLFNICSTVECFIVGLQRHGPLRTLLLSEETIRHQAFNVSDGYSFSNIYLCLLSSESFLSFI